MLERCPFQIRAPNDYGDHACFTPFMSRYCLQHFFLVSEIRSHKIGADEKKDDVSGLEVLVNRLPPLLSGNKLAVMPPFDEPPPLELPQRCPQRPNVRLVLVFFFNDSAPTEIYTLSLHDALVG